MFKTPIIQNLAQNAKFSSFWLCLNCVGTLKVSPDLTYQKNKKTEMVHAQLKHAKRCYTILNAKWICCHYSNGMVIIPPSILLKSGKVLS